MEQREKAGDGRRRASDARDGPFPDPSRNLPGTFPDPFFPDPLTGTLPGPFPDLSRNLPAGELVMLTMALRIARRSARGQPELLDALGDELALRQTELTSRERRMVASAFAYLGHEQPLHAVQDSGEEFFVG